MSTTALFVEHLITGLQALIWLTLMTICFYRNDANLSLLPFKGFEAQAMLLAFVFAYPLGILIDNLADWLFDKFICLFDKSKKSKNTVNVTELLARTKDTSLSSYLSYVRMRIRISRSSALNFALLTIFLIVFTWKNHGIPIVPINYYLLIGLETAVGTLLTVFFIFSWHNIREKYHEKIESASNLCREPSNGTNALL